MIGLLQSHKATKSLFTSTCLPEYFKAAIFPQICLTFIYPNNPKTANTTIATYADDTETLASDMDPFTASSALQQQFDLKRIKPTR